MSFAFADHAAGLLADLRVRVPGAEVMDDLPDVCRPKTLMDAYRIQARLRELLSFRAPGPQVGWKIGCTTPVMQSYLKIPHPCAGTLYRKSVCKRSIELRAADFFTLGLECEIAVRLAQDLPRLSQPRNSDSMLGTIAEVMASIEIVEHRFTDFTKVRAPTLVADDFFSAGCVIGSPMKPSELSDLRRLRGGFSIDDSRPEATGSGEEILGHPLTALAWLADHAAGLNTPLLKGQIVTLGSIVKTIYPEPGQVIEARIDRLPAAAVTVI
ncbi:MAG: fumarylacetoacetate hydrolase family protein [Pseudomonadota bacterium]